jgi:hypothetical protein
MMEAGNLGAYLANYRAEAVDDAVAILAEAPDATHAGYHDQAKLVLKKYERGAESLAIHTWFYDHEPTNEFAGHIAKYFSNGIREDVLLATAVHGIVFAPGSAGTIQEVFTDAAQNHYATFGYRSPMVLFGKKGFTVTLKDKVSQKDQYVEDERVHGLLESLAESGGYREFLTVSDNPLEIVEFIESHPPQRRP